MFRWLRLVIRGRAGAARPVPCVSREQSGPGSPEDGTLLRFAKATVDRTAQRVADAARVLAAKVAELEAARAERASLIAETGVLREELAMRDGAVG